MSAKTTAVPNAWDDDWEKQADDLATGPTPSSSTEKKVSSKVVKAQRRAQQAEFNRQLWAEAESPEAFPFLETQSNVPLKQDIKPAVTLLSRKPPRIASRQTPNVINSAAIGVSQLDLNNGNVDDDDDSDDEAKNKPPDPTPEERQAMMLRNREEKQRKYEEVRERLFSSPSTTGSGTSSTGSVTPPRPQHHLSGEGRGKGKSRGGGKDTSREKRDSSAASGKSGRLYDPDAASKPNSPYLQRRGRQRTDERTNVDQYQVPRQPIRNPISPDTSGRPGFGFGSRGARIG